MCWVTTHVLIIDHVFISPRYYAGNKNHVFQKILPRVLNWAPRKANASGEALADQMELKVWDVLREWRMCCLVWYSIDTWTWLDSWTSHRNKMFWRPPLSEIWTSGLRSLFGGDGCLSSTQGHDRSLSALLGKGLIWWGCWHLPEGEGCRYWLMMIRCCEELNKMISKVNSCSQSAVDVWLVSAYGIPALFFFWRS